MEILNKFCKIQMIVKNINKELPENEGLKILK